MKSADLQLFEDIKKGSSPEIRDIVIKILEKIPETRNNDTLLCFEIWIDQGVNMQQWRDHLARGEIITPETITRHRRYIQNVDGKLLPTRASVMITRGIAERHIRSFYATNPSIINDWEQLKYDIK